MKQTVLRGMMGFPCRELPEPPRVWEEALAADRVIVMAEGRLITQGTPREVFSRGRELRANGLDLPPIAMLRDKLIDGGMNIPADVITAEELAEAICPLK